MCQFKEEAGYVVQLLIAVLCWSRVFTNGSWIWWAGGVRVASRAEDGRGLRCLVVFVCSAPGEVAATSPTVPISIQPAKVESPQAWPTHVTTN